MAPIARRISEPLGWLVALAVVACGDDGPGGDGTTSGSSSGDLVDGPNPDSSSSGFGTTQGTSPDDTTDSTTGDVPEPMQPLSPYIVVDQFGYRPGAEKLAVIRSPVTGFDVGAPFTPGGSYAVVDAQTGEVVLEAVPVPWGGGVEDPSSGDMAWWFDFTSVDVPGDYFVLDVDRQVRSDVFRIADDVYRDVLAQAVRVLYYQRDGFPKDARYAGSEWADGPAHLGPGQGPECELYTGGSPRDLQGGWWDAGDQNKYTNWSANYSIALLRAYRERPAAFFDDYGIPESGNGVADVLDETKHDLDWLVRMQGPDGAVLSIVGQDGAPDPSFGGSPDTSPSSATGPCTYGPATTSASLTTAAAFALAGIVYAGSDAEGAFPGYADELAARAEQAWTWAEANPNVRFENAGTIGAGEQEVDNHGRDMKRLQAAVYLYELTGDPQYRDVVDDLYTETLMIANDYVDVFIQEEQDALLAYTQVPGATAAVVDEILTVFADEVIKDNNLGALTNEPDPYMAFLYVYVWGSNQVKADQGNLLYGVVTYDVAGPSAVDAARGAERYVHYVHGVNPLSLVYLSNMEDFGAVKSVTQIYHSWFAHASDWDAEGISMYGPPPGYLAGGPNPSYSWDGCCPDGCSGSSCGDAMPSPPANQPPQKSYLEFNDGWPLDSWSVTEPSNGYQVKYIRLLSKFVQ